MTVWTEVSSNLNQIYICVLAWLTSQTFVYNTNKRRIRFSSAMQRTENE